MKKLIALLWLVGAAAVFAADYPKPAGRIASSYERGVVTGVTGGIDATTAGWSTTNITISDPNNPVSSSAEINAAITAAGTSGTILQLPSGTIQINAISFYGGGISPQCGNVVLRGAGSGQLTGEGLTELVENGGNQISVGTGLLWPQYAIQSAVTGGMTAGSSKIYVADSSGFTAGTLCQLALANDTDPDNPVISPVQSDYVRYHVFYIVSKGPEANAINLSHTLPTDFNGVSAVLNGTYIGTQLNVGLEDLSVVAVGSTVGINVQGATRNFWLKNVKVGGATNYGVQIYNAVNPEIRKTWLTGVGYVGPSRANLLVNTLTGALIEDNILLTGGPNYEANEGLFLSAVLHNFSDDGTFNINHNAWNAFNLYQGNALSFVQSDGFRGGSSDDTLYRNWLMGANLGVTAYPVLSMKRWSRRYNVIGNIVQKEGLSGYDNDGMADWGQPNIGNGSYNETAQPSVGDWWYDYDTGTGKGKLWTGVLTARASNSAGTVTMDSGQVAGLAGHVTSQGGASNAGMIWPHGVYSVFVSSGGSGYTSPPTVTFTGVGITNVTAEATAVLTGDAVTSVTVTVSGDYTHPYSPTISFSGGGGTGAAATALMSSGNIAMIIGTISGDDVPVTATTSAELPAVGTPVTFYPGYNGYQELDLDVAASAIKIGNNHVYPSVGIPEAQSLGGQTLAPSWVNDGDTKPDWFGDLPWPPWDPTNRGTPSIEMIPAGYRYVNGTEDYLSGTTVATPTFTPSAGTHAAGTTVTMATSTSGASTYYTLDGSTPTESSTLYSSPVSLSVGTTVVKAISVKSGMTDSAVRTGTYILVNAPVAASGLNATTASTTQINVTWNDNSDNETGFRLERRIGAGSWSTVTTTAANATSYSNTGLTPATTYEYRVYAINVAGDSTASNTDSATTDSEGGGGAANVSVQNLNVGTFVIP